METKENNKPEVQFVNVNSPEVKILRAKIMSENYKTFQKLAAYDAQIPIK
jgi:hypothetical protein